MTDEERYITQGRTRDAAKKLESDLATLTSFFGEYSERLEYAKSTLTRFLADPSSKAADDRLMIDHINRAQRQLCEPGFFDSTSEFIEKTKKLRDLNEQIKRF